MNSTWILVEFEVFTLLGRCGSSLIGIDQNHCMVWISLSSRDINFTLFTWQPNFCWVIFSVSLLQLLNFALMVHQSNFLWLHKIWKELSAPRVAYCLNVLQVQAWKCGAIHFNGIHIYTSSAVMSGAWILLYLSLHSLDTWLLYAKVSSYAFISSVSWTYGWMNSRLLWCIGVDWFVDSIVVVRYNKNIVVWFYRESLQFNPWWLSCGCMV